MQMSFRRTIAFLIALALPVLARAQDASKFDFLLGHFELKVMPQARTLGQRMHGVPTYTGTWRARRTSKGRGIEDELRVVDDAGNTRSVTRFLRSYDTVAKAWRISTVDTTTGAPMATYRVTSEASALNVIAAAPGTDSEGKAYLSRGRFIEITDAAFIFLQERSYDGGRKWELIQRIEARRTASAMHG
jgi:hypothetical protein